jgi:trimethylamine---corrinoid protein Co-methyltransferase
MTKRANTLWKKMLAEYVPPPMDPGIDEALLDYMARRKAASPDSNV